MYDIRIHHWITSSASVICLTGPEVPAENFLSEKNNIRVRC